LRRSRLRFFASSIHKLVERWDKCLNKLGGYVKNESTMPKDFTFEFLTGKNLLVFVNLFIFTTPNSVAAAAGNISQCDCALSTSDVIIMMSLL